jgi:hypothetical protein
MTIRYQFGEATPPAVEQQAIVGDVRPLPPPGAVPATQGLSANDLCY